MLMSLSRRCSLRRAAGGRKRHTACRAFVALSSSSPDWGSAVQHKKQCCTMLSKYRVSGKDSEPRNSPKREAELLYQALKLKFRISGKDSKPRNSQKTEVELLYQALKLKFRVSGKDSRAQVQSEEGGGAAVPDLQTKVQSLGKIQSSGTVRRGRWSCCTRLQS